MTKKGLMAKDLAVELNLILQQLEIKDYLRIIQTLKSSINSKVFVNELEKTSKLSESEVLTALNQCGLNSVSTDFVLRSSKASTNNLNNYLAIKRKLVKEIQFVFRDEMVEYVGRFLKISSDLDKRDNSDLEDTVLRLENYLKKIDLKKIKYLVTSGIGANEMYSHQLAFVVNRHFEIKNKNLRWFVVNNPAHLKLIPKDANNQNTLCFEMSRSGKTKETIDFFNVSKGLWKKRVVVANVNTLKELAKELRQDKEAEVLIIDDTRGDIGGRQMNRKTLMVFAPLFMALSIGLEDLNKARHYLEIYVRSLFTANQELDYKNENSQAISLAEFLLKERELGRNKILIIHDEDLRGIAKELFQLLNEGANKTTTNGVNNNIASIYKLRQEREIYEIIINNNEVPLLPIFILDKTSKDFEVTKKQIAELEIKEIPCLVLELNITNDLEKDLGLLARTSSLIQDMVVYFTYLTNQDPNSNPAVKLVREITAVMFEILEKRQNQDDTRINMDEVKKKIEDSDRNNKLQAKEALDKIEVKKEYRKEFDGLVGSLKKISYELKIPETKIVTILLESISKNVLLTDIGEAAGSSKPQQVTIEAFDRSKLSRDLGVLVSEQKITTLDKQVFIKEDKQIRVSVVMDRNDKQINNISDYLFKMYQKRDRVEYLALVYMEASDGDERINEINKIIAKEFSKLNISPLMLALPGVAHTGIEAVMSHPENIMVMAVIGTQDRTNYVYGISNVVRMALGGSPSVIFEIESETQLDDVKKEVLAALKIFKQKISGQ